MLPFPVSNADKTNFELYNYIVLVILDNKCKSEYFIQTCDNANVLINSGFLSKIQQNQTLKGVSRLFVIQKLLDVADMDDDEMAADRVVTAGNIKIKKSGGRKYLGSTVSIKGMEKTNNFVKSPFIKVFAQEFENNAKNMEIDEIGDPIRKVLENDYQYRR